MLNRRVVLNQLPIVRDYTILTVAAALSAMSAILYLIPSEIAPGGLYSVSIIINALFGTPVGLVTLLLNIPVFWLGYRMLGGWGPMAKTIFFIVVFSLMLDLLIPVLPSSGISDERLLNAIFSGIFSGISSAMAYNVGATGGGTSTLTRILQVKWGLPISASSLYIDGAIIAVSGLIFGLESIMFAIIVIIIYGAVTDYVQEGPSLIRTATIITDQPEAVAETVLHKLGRGVTGWEATGMYTGQARHVLFVTVNRAQVRDLRQLVSIADPTAFVVVGQGHVAYGQGFKISRSIS
jgi:uncharacterized membrane-anchored protein YitT (DUF2179 family)